jgi:hypothetical protein
LAPQRQQKSWVIRIEAEVNEQPNLPYILFHPKFLWKFSGEHFENEMSERSLETGWWRAGDCFTVDIECRKFPLLDVKNLGAAWTLSNLFNWGSRKKYRLFKVQYVFGEATQLTFERARDDFVEYVCQRRWWSASYETEAQFRARNATYTNMRDLMKPVGLKGKRPWDRR